MKKIDSYMNKYLAIGLLAAPLNFLQAQEDMLLGGWGFSNIDGGYNLENIEADHTDPSTRDFSQPSTFDPGGTLLLDGTNGSSDFPEQQLNTLNGAIYNASNLVQNESLSTRFNETFSNTPSALEFSNNFLTDASGSAIVFALVELDGFTYENVRLTYAAGLPLQDGPVSISWEYSTDASTWIDLGSDSITTSDQLGTTMDASAEEGSSTFYFRATLGAITSTVILDNVQIIGQVVEIPEPETPPVFADDEVTIEMLNGDAQTITVSATGSPTITYEWFIGTEGDTSVSVDNMDEKVQAEVDSLTLIRFNGNTDNLSYWLRATNAFGSDSVQITINPGESDSLADSFDGGTGIDPISGGLTTPIGTLLTRFYPWVFHDDLGWLWLWGDPSSTLWCYSDTIKSWIWTREGVYPWIYSDANTGWWYLREGSDPTTVFDDNTSMDVPLADFIPQ